MTTKRVPLCQVKGCPHPSDPDWHRCFVCGKAEGDHQHFPKKSLAGKGAKIVAFLCRYHHERITLHEWREGVYTHPDGSKRYYVQNAKGVEMCERLIEAAPKDKDTDTSQEVILTSPLQEGQCAVLEPLEEPQRGRVITVRPARKEGLPLDRIPDEQLAALFAEADKSQAEGFLLKCRIVHTFRERHVQSWGESWIEEAYSLFHVSRRTLNVYANLHEILDTSDPYLTEQIAPLTDSKSLMQHIGRKKPEDGKVALEAAVAHLAEFGEAPTVAALQHRLGEEAKPPEPCPNSPTRLHEYVCRYCGKEK